jgi:hypothetical protein
MEIDHADALFDSTYLRWFHLDGPALCKIVKVERKVPMTLPGGVETKKPVIYFEQVGGKKAELKPLVLNVTNKNAIKHIHGPRPSDWAGKLVVLFQSEVEMYDRDLKKKVTRECIRIRAQKEQPTQEKTNA